MEEIQITVEYLEPGPRGEKGWTALYSDESYIVNGKQRIIKKLTDYVGGQGTKPTEGLGLYLAESGLFTADKNLAFDYKGIQGERPGHEWTETSLAIENTDGTMGEAVDLKGDSAYQLWLDAGNVGTMADFLYSLKKDSVDAAATANSAAVNANEKAIAAQLSADNANQATQAANTATSNAVSAAAIANEKAGLADTKATLADQKATLANDAATNANSKAAAAQTATTNANTATTNANAATTAANNAATTANSARGWTPVYALVDDGIRTVQKLVDYVGGTGNKPTANINSYVTNTGFSTVIADGKDVRGTAGLAGVSRIPVWTASVYANNSSVQYLGKYWTSNAATLATDIPGTSAKWIEDLTSYNPRNKQVLDFTANRMIVASDNNSLLRGNAETDLNLIIPANSTAALPIGFQVLVKQQGVGRIIVVTEQGVTLESPESKVNSNMQFAQFWLIKEGTDRWSLEGSLVKDILTTFYSQVTSDGGTTEGGLIKQGFNEMDVKFRNQASVLLIPGAYKSGKIYGMNPVSGAIVPFTFTRAGTATYFDKNGIMQTAAANMPRIDYDPVTKECKGYLIEGAATNLIPNSNTVTVVAEGITRTNNAGSSPMGINDAIRISGLAQATPATAFQSSSYTNTFDGITNYIGAIWVKGEGVNIGKKVTMRLQASNGQLQSNNIFTLTGDWQRIVTTAWVPSAGTALLSLRFVGSVLTDRADEFLMWNNQIEQGSSISSDIVTTSSQVTRAADIVRSVSNVTPGVESTMFFYGSGTFNEYSTYSADYMRRGVDPEGRFYYAVKNSYVRIYAGGKGLSNSDGFVSNSETIKVASSFGASEMKITAKGRPISKIEFKGSSGAGGLLAMGTGAGFVRELIKTLAIFPTQLSDSDHITLTT